LEWGQLQALLNLSGALNRPRGGGHTSHSREDPLHRNQNRRNHDLYFPRTHHCLDGRWFPGQNLGRGRSSAAPMLSKSVHITIIKGNNFSHLALIRSQLVILISKTYLQSFVCEIYLLLAGLGYRRHFNGIRYPRMLSGGSGISRDELFGISQADKGDTGYFERNRSSCR
jgi:hypothetical protein